MGAEQLSDFHFSFDLDYLDDLPSCNESAIWGFEPPVKKQRLETNSLAFETWQAVLPPEEDCLWLSSTASHTSETTDTAEGISLLDDTGSQSHISTSLPAGIVSTDQCTEQGNISGGSLTNRLAEIVRKRRILPDVNFPFANEKKRRKSDFPDVIGLIRGALQQSHDDGVRCKSKSQFFFMPSGIPTESTSIPRPLSTASTKETILRSLGVDIPAKWLDSPRLTVGEDDEKSVSMSDSSLSTAALRSALLSLAEALSSQEAGRAAILTGFLEESTSSKGSAVQRVALCFLKGLTARGRGDFIHYPIRSKFSAVTGQAVWRFVSKLPCLLFWMEATAGAILDAVEGENFIHVVDFGIWTGQWGALLRQLSQRGGGPPHVRFTAVSAPPGTPSGIGPVVCVDSFRAEVTALAEEAGLSFEFEVLTIEMTQLKPELLKLRKGEALVINCAIRLSQLLDSGTARWNPRNNVLQMLRDLNPCVLTMGEIEMDTNGLFFLSRFKDSFDTYQGLYASLDELADRSDIGREAFEQQIFGREIVNIVACEGLQRVCRHERSEKWIRRMQRIGFANRNVKESLRAVLEKSIQSRGTGYRIRFSKGLLNVSLRGREVGFAAAWQPFQRALPTVLV